MILIKQSLKDLKSEFPPIQELVPHARTMCLLDRLVAWDGSKARCVLTVSEKDPFADSFGRIPAYVGIEYISQCAAAHASLKKKRGKGRFITQSSPIDKYPQSGFFCGSLHYGTNFGNSNC